MTLGQDFQLKESMLAVVVDPSGKKTATTIPAGERLRLSGAAATDSRYLSVLWEGRQCEVFAVDFEERSEPVKTVREARV